ncbi:MAG: J domain-containing protein [Terracidiphilus sp.]
MDYYEFLQISPNADSDTIHRVYRFLATRLHPDNPESGDAEMFHLLKTAYDVLSHPDRRADYDATRRRQPCQPIPLSTSIDFMDSLDGELNRRLAVLAVLYYRRRSNPQMPEVPLAEIELRMGFPRDYLDFTTWYLVKKGYVLRADNAEYTLTAEGVDFVETQRANLPILNKMLTNGSVTPAATTVRPARHSGAAPEPIVLPLPMGIERRAGMSNGHARAPELRAEAAETLVDTIDRRASSGDRRASLPGRRSND